MVKPLNLVSGIPKREGKEGEEEREEEVGRRRKRKEEIIEPCERSGHREYAQLKLGILVLSHISHGVNGFALLRDLYCDVQRGLKAAKLTDHVLPEPSKLRARVSPFFR